jgi:1-aminocyclopropane-1-carboxylate deaminase
MFDDFPQFSDQHYASLTETLDPISVEHGYSIKRGDLFELGPVNGSKVRQCLHVVKHLRKGHDGLVTGAGLPSPQTAIVAAVAKYYGLKCAVVTPEYRDGMRDFDRINSSLAQRLGADVYGVGNPNPTGYEKDARVLAAHLNFLQIKFGMYGRLSMEPVIRQVENVPDHVERIVVIAGSGLSALSILRGLARYRKRNVKIVDVVTLSDHFVKNRKTFYDTQRAEVFDGTTRIHRSPFEYRFKLFAGPALDLTYESKAWRWMIENVPPSEKVLFWIVGKRCYDLDMIQQINWHRSPHEQRLRTEQPSLWPKTSMT